MQLAGVPPTGPGAQADRQSRASSWWVTVDGLERVAAQGHVGKGRHQ